MYTPDRWEIVRIEHEGKTHERVFATWRGGYLVGDSWRFSSGITKIVEHDTYYEVHNQSGSIYQCKKGKQGMSAYTEAVYCEMEHEISTTQKGTMQIIDIKELVK